MALTGRMRWMLGALALGAGLAAPLEAEPQATATADLIGKPAPPWQVEHWINSRPLQLEDLRGALFAQSKLEQTPPDLNGFLDGIQFYFPDQPGVDVNGNGIQDPPFALPDALVRGLRWRG